MTTTAETLRPAPGGLAAKPATPTVHAWICQTCGTQHSPGPHPPLACAICNDERQYVGREGQLWTTREALAERHIVRIEEAQGGALTLGLAPAFAINQRAWHLQTDAGNILWESLSLVTEEALAALAARGGVDLIAISHPHFYAAMVDWSEALGDVPILLHAADREWVQRPDSRIRFWEGDRFSLSEDVTLIRCGGHFPGCTALHWRAGPCEGGALFSGDTPQVVLDRRHVGFMVSYPNLIPMPPIEVRAMRERLVGFDFEDVHGYTWGRDIIGEGRAAVDASFDRYLKAVGA